VADGTPRLLVVDDEVTHLRALCDTLRDSGYEVEGHTSAADALQALRASPFDLILTDLHMPGTSGIDLLRQALEVDPTLAAVMMTGAGSIGSAVEAMRSGALDYVLKPFKLKTTLPAKRRAGSADPCAARRTRRGQCRSRVIFVIGFARFTRAFAGHQRLQRDFGRQVWLGAR
jgi:DNA-binding NtrC family response regulator